MHQQLLAPLPEAASQKYIVLQPGTATGHLKGPLGALLQLCAALFHCSDGYVSAAADAPTGLSELKARSISYSGKGLFPALAAACTAVHAALKPQQQQQQQQQQQNEQPGGHSGSSRTRSTYAEEAEAVVLRLVAWISSVWFIKFEDGLLVLPDLQPAVALAATVLRICGARLQGRQPDGIAAACSSSSSSLQLAATDAADSVSSEAEVAGSSSSSSSCSGDDSSTGTSNGSSGSEDVSAWGSSSKLCMSMPLRAARYSSLKLATFFATLLSKELAEKLEADPTTRQVVACDDLLLLLAAAMGLAAFSVYKQTR
jgi:hypothetical protein